MQNAPLKTKIERFIFRRNNRQRPHPNQGGRRIRRRIRVPHFSRAFCARSGDLGRPPTHRPPLIQLSHALKVSPSHHDRLPIAGPRHHHPKRSRNPSSSQNRIYMRQCVRGKGSAVPCNQNDIRPIVAKLPPQLRLHVDIEIEHRRRHSSRDYHREQSRQSASSSQNRRPHEHAQEHRRMRSPRAASRQILSRVRHSNVCPRCAHNSPRSANTGSRRTARRIAIALPAKVTITAIARITGNSTGEIEISELKIECPI